MARMTINRESIRWLALESTAIIISILLAFSIDAWWEGRQDDLRREALIQALKLDFEITRDRLETSIETANSTIERTMQFLEASGSQEQYSLEELGGMVGGISKGIFFTESLSSYESAVATGDISLVAEPELMGSISEFYDALTRYDNQFAIAGEIFYLGSMWELRREVGNAAIFNVDDRAFDVGRFELSEDEFRELFAGNLVYAAVQNTTLVNFNMKSALEDMAASVESILAVLEDIE